MQCLHDSGSSAPASSLNLSPACLLSCSVELGSSFLPLPTHLHLPFTQETKPETKERGTDPLPVCLPSQQVRRHPGSNQEKMILEKYIGKSLGFGVRLSGLASLPQQGASSFYFSELRFLHLKNGDSKSSLARWSRRLHGWWARSRASSISTSDREVLRTRSHTTGVLLLFSCPRGSRSPPQGLLSAHRPGCPHPSG